MRVDVEVCLEVKAGYFPEAVGMGVRLRLEERFLTFSKGETVSQSMLLAAVQSVEGVVLAELVQPREDIKIPADETAVLGKLLIQKKVKG